MKLKLIIVVVFVLFFIENRLYACISYGGQLFSSDYLLSIDDPNGDYWYEGVREVHFVCYEPGSGRPEYVDVDNFYSPYTVNLQLQVVSGAFWEYAIIVRGQSGNIIACRCARSSVFVRVKDAVFDDMGCMWGGCGTTNLVYDVLSGSGCGEDDYEPDVMGYLYPEGFLFSEQNLVFTVPNISNWGDTVAGPEAPDYQVDMYLQPVDDSYPYSDPGTFDMGLERAKVKATRDYMDLNLKECVFEFAIPGKEQPQAFSLWSGVNPFPESDTDEALLGFVTDVFRPFCGVIMTYYFIKKVFQRLRQI